MWDKRDWHHFFQIAQRPWQRRRPPRPVAPSGVNRVLPTVGFSLSELDDAGINLEAAERFGLPVDARANWRLRSQRFGASGFCAHSATARFIAGAGRTPSVVGRFL